MTTTTMLEMLFAPYAASLAGEGWLVVCGDGDEPGSGWVALVRTEGDCGYGAYRFRLNKTLEIGSRLKVRFPLDDGVMVDRECVVGARLDLSGLSNYRYTAIEVGREAHVLASDEAREVSMVSEASDESFCLEDALAA